MGRSTALLLHHWTYNLGVQVRSGPAKTCRFLCQIAFCYCLAPSLLGVEYLSSAGSTSAQLTNKSMPIKPTLAVDCKLCECCCTQLPNKYSKLTYLRIFNVQPTSKPLISQPVLRTCDCFITVLLFTIFGIHLPFMVRMDHAYFRN